MGLTKQQLEALNNNSFPNNNAGAITPAILRDYNTSAIANTVNQDAYTTDSASFDSRIDGLATTSSVNAISTSVGLLQTFSGSQYKADSASFSSRIEAVTGSGGTVNTGSLLVTASAAGNTITFTKGDSSTFNVSVSGGTIDTSSFATTGSNTFIGNQSIEGNLYISSSTQNDVVVNGQMFVSSSATAGATQPKITVSGSAGQTIINRNSITTRNTTDNGGIFPSTLYTQDIATSDEIGFTVDTSVFGITGWSTGPAFYVNNTALDTYPAVFGFQNKANYTDGRVTVLTALSASAGFTSSNAFINGELYSNTSASFDSRINAITGSSINTGSFATTGSNTFVGNQIVSGTFSISGSNTLGSGTQLAGTLIKSRMVLSGGNGVDSPTPRFWISGSDGATNQIGRGFVDINVTPATGLGSSITQYGDDTSTVTFAQGVYNATTFANDVELYIETNVSGTQFKDYDQTAFDYTPWLTIGANNGVTIPTPTFTRGLVVTGSAIFTELTGSLGAFSASVSTRINSISGSGGGGGATLASNTFTGNQTIEGAIVSNPTTAITKLFSQAFVSGAVQLNITASNAISQSNLVFGGTELNSGQTGSVVISGSNNILLSAGRNNTLATGFSYGYLGGNNNIVVVTIPTLNTGSLLTPTMTGNIGQGTFTMNFITSSLTAPSITNNIMNGGVSINHQSGSISYNNNINNTSVTSTANITNLPFLTTLNSNAFLGAAVTFNHISSSITALQNVGGGVTVNNNVSTSLSTSTNGLSVNANHFGGSGNIIYTSGSGVSTRRNVTYNLFGGNTNVISASAFNSENQNLIGTAIWGTGLTISATTNGTGTTAGGGAFFGRFNDTNNLYNDSGKIVFAVGTGTSTSARKTALSIDSGSNVLVSGSLIVVNSDSSKLSIDANAVVSASKVYIGNQSIGVEFAPSTGSITDSYTRYGKDSFQIYQYQGQQYAFGVICTADQLNQYTGSQFRWGTVNGTGAITDYMNMVSASFTGSIGSGTPIPGLDYLKNGEIVNFSRGTTFGKNVYIQQGLYVSQSAGGGTPAITINGSGGGGGALLATGSCTITGSLTLNGQTTFASLDSNTFTNTQIVSSSIYIAPNSDNNQLYLPSGSNKQTGLATLNGGNPGTVTVSNTNVTANSIIMLTKQTLAHPNGYVAISSKGSGTFTITSNHNGDTDIVAFMIINPS